MCHCFSWTAELPILSKLLAGTCLKIWGSNMTWSALSGGDAQFHAPGAHKIRNNNCLEEMQLHHKENCLLFIWISLKWVPCLNEFAVAGLFYRSSGVCLWCWVNWTGTSPSSWFGSQLTQPAWAWVVLTCIDWPEVGLWSRASLSTTSQPLRSTEQTWPGSFQCSWAPSQDLCTKSGAEGTASPVPNKCEFK